MTNQSTDDIAIPDEFAESLRRAATGLPGGPPNLADVHRRRRHRQMRRSVVTLAGVGVLVAASIVTPRLLTGSATPAESAVPAVSASPTPPPAQRLFLSGQAWAVKVAANAGTDAVPQRLDPSLPNFGFPPGSIGVVQLGPLEVTAAGGVVPIEVPGANHRDHQVLDDGRIATLEWLSRSDTPSHETFCVTDPPLYLRVYQTDGTQSLSRDVGARCEDTSIAGAGDTEVFLIRTPHDEQYQAPTAGRQLVAHNLADGTERTVANLDTIAQEIWDTNIRAGLIVAIPSSYGCQVQTLDIDTGVVATLDMPALVADCVYVVQAKLSPDGHLLAVTYSTGEPGVDERYEIGFAVVDLAGPTLRLREVVQSLPPAHIAAHAWGGALVEVRGDMAQAGRWFLTYYPAGTAWSDNSTVRHASVVLPEGLDRVVGIEEVLDVQTYVVR